MSASSTSATYCTGSAVGAAAATARTSLLFTWSAAGAATLSVTDVAGASGKTVYLRLTPVADSGSATVGGPAITSLTFD